jgi:hypothetical protein
MSIVISLFVNSSDLQDNLSAEWPFSLIKGIVLGRILQYDIDTVRLTSGLTNDR